MSSSKTFTWSLNWVSRFGMNPFESFSISRVKFFVLTLVFVVFPLFMLTFQLFRVELNLENLTAFAEAFGTVYQAYWKAYTASTKTKKIAKAYSAIDDFLCNNIENGRTELARIVEEKHEQAWICYRNFLYFVSCATTIYVTKPILFSARILPVAYTFGCDLEESLCYYPCWLFQIVSTAIVIGYISTCDGVFFGTVSFAIIELEVIKYELIHLVDPNVEEDEEIYMNKLRKIVKHHNGVLDFIHQLDDVYNILFFHQMSSSLFGICIAIFEISLEGGNTPIPVLLKYITFLLAYYLQLMAYCVVGEYLMGQAASVADEAYNCEWQVRHLPKVTNGLIMIIRRAQRDVKITMGNIFDLNLELFASVARSSFSVFTLLQTMCEK